MALEVKFLSGGNGGGTPAQAATPAPAPVSEDEIPF